jgi:hypothetical protein
MHPLKEELYKLDKTLLARLVLIQLVNNMPNFDEEEIIESFCKPPYNMDEYVIRKTYSDVRDLWNRYWYEEDRILAIKRYIGEILEVPVEEEMKEGERDERGSD